MNRYRIDNFQGLLLTINGPQLFEFFYKKVIENISTKNKVNWNRPWCLSGLRRYLKFKKRECLWFQLQITARDNKIDRSEVEILCRYSNSKAPGDMCPPLSFDHHDIQINNIGKLSLYTSLFIGE